jgi:hypothetical protein
MHESVFRANIKCINKFFVKSNEHDNPGFVLFREIVQKFWTSPQEEKDKARSWSEIK